MGLQEMVAIAIFLPWRLVLLDGPPETDRVVVFLF